MRRRFFVEKFEDGSAALEGEVANHLGRVLRAQPGQQYELSDGQKVWLARVENAGRDRVEFALEEELAAYQPQVETTLLLAVVKFDSFEWAIEKATELGVATITPVAAARSEKGLLAAVQKRSERWRKILLEAAQQSRRLRVPALENLKNVKEAFSAGVAEAGSPLKILLSENAQARGLAAVLGGQRAGRATLAIGPEGGWTEAEFALAREASFREASLGRLILRTETAVIAALASMNYAFEESEGNG